MVYGTSELLLVLKETIKRLFFLFMLHVTRTLIKKVNQIDPLLVISSYIEDCY